MFSITDYIKHQLSLSLKICKRQNKTTSRGAHFVWSHIVCFSYETPAGRFNFEFVQTYSNYMISIWLVCLISRAPLAGATPKYPARTTPTQPRAFQTSQVYSSRMPIVLGLRSKHFQLYKQDAQLQPKRRKYGIYTETQNNYRKNNESSTEMTINYIHVYAYTILNHIQYRYTTPTPHERHGIPNTGNLTLF